MNIIFTLGRFNPPTIGHERLFSIILDSSYVPFVFIVDGEKSGKDLLRNPLPAEYRKELLEQYGFNVEIVKNAYEAYEYIEDYANKSVLVCGDDRAENYSKLFKTSEIITIPRNEISGTMAREAALKSLEDFKPLISDKFKKDITKIRQHIRFGVLANGEYPKPSSPQSGRKRR